MQTNGAPQTDPVSNQLTPAVAQDYLNNYINDCIKNGEDPAKIIKAFRIDRKAVEAILADVDCVYVRMYFGLAAPSEDLVADYTLMMVGVDTDNQNLLAGGQIYDNSVKCPSGCPKNDFI